MPVGFGDCGKARQRHSSPLPQESDALLLSPNPLFLRSPVNPRETPHFLPHIDGSLKPSKALAQTGWGGRIRTSESRRQRLTPGRLLLAIAEREVLLQRGEIGSAEAVRRTADDLNRMKWRFSKLVRCCPRRCHVRSSGIRGLEDRTLTL
jgi:hypothetical protein